VSLSILIVDDEPDVAELFRQRFRREVRQGLYVLHFAYSAEEALEKLDTGILLEISVVSVFEIQYTPCGVCVGRSVKRRVGAERKRLCRSIWCVPLEMTSRGADAAIIATANSAPSRFISTC
jgi:CheY-like chemotaxis protein